MKSNLKRQLNHLWWMFLMAVIILFMLGTTAILEYVMH